MTQKTTTAPPTKTAMGPKNLRNLTKIDETGEIIYSAKLNHVNQSVIELNDGDVVMGGFGFREGNSGGPISLLRLDPSSLE